MTMKLPIALSAILGLSVAAHAENKVVFLAGGRSHGPGEHEFYAGCQLLAKALNQQKGVDLKAEVVRGWPADQTVLDGARAVVIYADGTSVVGKGWEKMDSLAKKGVGIMFMHYAVHPSAPEGEKYYRPWIGGAFETGWSVNPHWVADMKALPDHPVSRGVPSEVEAFDEFYYNMRFRPQRGEVLDLVTATPTRERMKRYINLWNEHGVAGLGKSQTLMWGVQRPDGGRGVGFTGGHYHRNWAVDGFRTLALNAIVWVAGLEVPAQGVSSAPLTEDDLNANLDDKGTNKPRLRVPESGEFKAIPTAEVQTDREAKFPKLGAESQSAPLTVASNASVTVSAVGKGAADAKPVAETGLLTSASAERLVSLTAPLKGAKELYLVVDPEGEIACDWSNWIEPTLVFADGTRKELGSLGWKSASSGWGQARVNLNMEGKPLRVDGKTFEKGIGVHAASVVAYDLPPGVERLETRVGLDDGGAIRGGQPSTAKVRFRVYTSQPPKPGQLAEPIAADWPTEVPTELFTLPDGLEVTLWAKSPLLRNPTNIDFDAQGRLWVAEGVNYRGKAKRQPEGDRIVVLEDSTGAGVADKSTVFVQEPGLASPLGVAVFGNRVVVSQPPDMLVYTDVNGDGKFDPAVDKKEVLLTGFGGRQHDHSLHSVTAGPDGLWYWNQGNTGAEFTDKSGKTFRMGSPYMFQNIAGQRSDDGHVWIGGFAARMNPDGSRVSIIGHNFRNSYEQAVTSMGDVFQSDNDDPPACRVTALLEGGNAGFASADGKRAWAADRRPGQSVPTAEWRQEDPGTMPAGDIYGGGAPTGVAFYENGALGEKWQGLLLACESGKNVIYGYRPESNGADWKLERMDFFTSNKEREWAGSDFLSGRTTRPGLKNWFRPSDVCVGPDGAIYVADWYDPGVGGHGTRDDRTTGAIYRVAPKGFKPIVPKFDLDTTEGQIAALKSPAVNVRHSGFVRLKEQGQRVVPAVAELLQDANPYIRARAVFLLAQLGENGIQRVRAELDSGDARQRLVAFRALKRAGVDHLELARKLAGDSSAAVRREVATGLRDVPAAESVSLLAKIAAQFDGKDRAYLDAIGLGSEGKESAVYAALSGLLGKDPLQWKDSAAWLAWRLHPVEAVPALAARASSSNLSAEQRKLMLTALAFTPSAGAADAVLAVAADKTSPLGGLALWWLLNRKTNDWAGHGLDAKLKTAGLYDPDNIQLVAVQLPPAVPNPQALPSPSEIARINGDPVRGKSAVAACYACHKVGGTGVEYGPELTEYGKQQTAEMIIEAISNPSGSIAHGYAGSEVKTKDGLIIQGMALATGDPVVLKCMGGTLQTIPRSRIESMAQMKRSLMYEPAQLGLTAQAIADIVAYLKSL
jgi:putative membrane-bound dehydrogenase-like protein